MDKAKIKRVINYLISPRFYASNLIHCQRLSKYIPDRIYLRLQYYVNTGEHLNLKSPRKLNEKLQWLKLYNRKQEYSLLVDKYSVKKYISDNIGPEFVIPCYGVWDDADDIVLDSLPDSFVLKCTHDSGSTIVVRNKKLLNWEQTKNKLSKCLNVNCYTLGREWPYKNVKPRIIAEKLMLNSDGSPIVDYKFYCFGGKPQYFMYSVGEASHHVKNCKFDMDGNNIDHLFKNKRALENEEIKLPKNLNTMKNIVSQLCVGMPHVRIDLYNIDGQIFFGEYTFFSGNGYIKMVSNEFSNYLAGLIICKRP